MEERSFTVVLSLRDGYEFTADFVDLDVPDLLLDEPPPLGAGRGPSPTRLLAAAIGDCLGSSLLFCLRKARVEVRELRVRVEGTIERNERGRLRIASMRVFLEPSVERDQIERMGRCLEVFEDFCTVTQSIRDGVDVQVEVAPVAAGAESATEA